MTDECRHQTTAYWPHKSGQLWFCFACGRLLIIKNNTVIAKKHLYNTDTVREMLIDKLGEWFGRGFTRE